jgi:hypothetical protein
MDVQVCRCDCLAVDHVDVYDAASHQIGPSQRERHCLPPPIGASTVAIWNQK